MRPIIRKLILVFSLMLPATLSLADHAPLPDSVKGIPRDRFQEFWDTYSIENLHYSNYDVPNRMVGYFGRIDSSSSLVNAAMGFLEANHDVFRINDVQSELALDAVTTNEDGGRSIVLQQMSHGLEVVGCHLSFEITPVWSMEAIYGRYIPGVKVAVKPQIDSVAAIAIARDSLARAGIEAGALTGTLCILPQEKSFLLAWQVDRPGQPGQSKRVDPIYVDAHSGAIVFRDDS